MNRQERLVFTLQRQLVPPETVGHQFGIQTWGLPAAGAFGPQSLGKTVPMDNSMVYLGEVSLCTILHDGLVTDAAVCFNFPQPLLLLRMECYVSGCRRACLISLSAIKELQCQH